MLTDIYRGRWTAKGGPKEREFSNAYVSSLGAIFGTTFCAVIENQEALLAAWQCLPRVRQMWKPVARRRLQIPLKWHRPCSLLLPCNTSRTAGRVAYWLAPETAVTASMSCQGQGRLLEVSEGSGGPLRTSARCVLGLVH